MKFIVTLVGLLFFHPLVGEEWTRAQIDQGKRLVGQVMKIASNNAIRKYHLSSYGAGLSMPGGPIRLICLSFQAVGQVAQNDARRLVVACVNEVVQAANKTPSFEHYLYSPPFTSDNAEITIFFKDAHGDTVPDPYIGVVTALDGVIYYDTYDPRGLYFDYKQSMTETYQKALEAIKKETEEYQSRQGTQG